MSTPQGERAASFVELCLVLPLILFLVLGTIDVARYMFTVTTMRRAIERGANSGELDSELFVDFWSSANSSDPQVLSFRNASSRISSDVLGLADMVSDSSRTPRYGMRRVRYELIGPASVYSGTSTSREDVLILLPGMVAEEVIVSADGSERRERIEHPGVCHQNYTCAHQRTIAFGASMETLSQSQPVLLRMRMQLEPISPLFRLFGSDFDIIIEQMFYREISTAASYPETIAGSGITSASSLSSSSSSVASSSSSQNSSTSSSGQSSSAVACAVNTDCLGQCGIIQPGRCCECRQGTCQSIACGGN